MATAAVSTVTRRDIDDQIAIPGDYQRRGRRSPALIAGLYALVLIVLSIDSPPRRVGDGGEYFVMAERLARFQNPALTRSELDEARASLRRLGSGFDVALLDYPQLVGADGRQSFLHFWLYPLVATPGVWLANALQLHPNWAFTLTNIALLVGAAFVLARAAPAACVVYVLASPIVWWVDKAHTEVFLYAALSIAVALVIGHRPVWAMLAFAAAGAQNAAIAIAYPVFAAVAAMLSRRAGRMRVQHGVGALAGALIVALPFVYNWLRLGRMAPMSEYAHFSPPSLAAMLGFVLEPNMGLAPAMPGYLLVIAGVVLVMVRRSLPPAMWWPAVMQLVLLFVWTQNPNANHGGTPGVNRWTLSLVPLTLPWAVAAYTASPPGARRAFIALVILAASYSVYSHLPRRPESYLQPTSLAQALWGHGWLRTTSAEVFAERTSASETPLVPIADDRCHVVLVWDMQWPLECVPPDRELPRACGGVESFCLTAQRDAGFNVVPVSFNGFFFRPSPQSWPASGPLASGVHAAMVSIAPNAGRWQVVSERQLVREKNAVEGLVLLQTKSGMLIYIARTGAMPLLAVRTASAAEAALHSLLPFRELARSTSLDNDGVLTPALPPHASNLALIIRTQENR